MIFCEHCRDEVGYTTTRVQRETTVKGEKLNYRGKEARCAECQNVIFVPDIHDYNLKQLNKKYF